MVSPPFSPKLSDDFINKLLTGNDHLSINITNIRLRTYVGINEWEQEHKQDVVINITVQCAKKTMVSCSSDKIEDTVNYKKLSKQVIKYVEGSRFYLLEKLVAGVLEIVLKQPLVLSAKVTGEKPGALRFSDSVGLSISGTNS